MEIILYSTHCPRCTVLEAKLKQKNIEYQEINNIDEMLKLGIQAVPQLKVDGKLMDFSEAIKWVNMR